MSTTTDAMRKAARAAIEKSPLPAPPVLVAMEEIKARLDRLEPNTQAAMAEVREVMAVIRAGADNSERLTNELIEVIEDLSRKQAMGQPTAAVCEAAAARMTRAAGEVSTAAGLLQEVARHFRDAVAEVLEHREGRGRRMAVALLLAAALPGVLGNIWLAWRAHLL